MEKVFEADKRLCRDSVYTCSEYSVDDHQRGIVRLELLSGAECCDFTDASLGKRLLVACTGCGNC